VVFKDGVVLGADTRATGGDIVADKNCMKIHPLAPNMVSIQKSSFKLKELKTLNFGV